MSPNGTSATFAGRGAISGIDSEAEILAQLKARYPRLPEEISHEQTMGVPTTDRSR